MGAFKTKTVMQGFNMSDNKIKNYIDRCKRDRRYKRRFLWLITALSLFVCLFVFWGLSSTGTAMVKKVYTDLSPTATATDASESNDDSDASDISTEDKTEEVTSEEKNGEEGADTAKSDVENTDTEDSGTETADTENDKKEEDKDKDKDKEDTTEENKCEEYEKLLEKEIIDGKAVYKAVSEKDIKVEITADPDTFDEEVRLKATDIADKKAEKMVEDNLCEYRKLEDAIALDIAFINEKGEEKEPDPEKVSVKIDLPDDISLEGEELCVLHEKEDGKVEKVEDAEIDEAGAEFEAETFSVYVLTAMGWIDSDHLNEYYFMANGQERPHNDNYFYNTPQSPYIMYVGDTLIVSQIRSKDDGHASDEGFSVWHNGYGDNVVLKRPSDHPYNEFEELDANTVRSKAYYVANRKGNVEAHFANHDGDPDKWVLYIEVRDGSEYEQLDHFDIEVPNGTTFTKTVIHTDSDGNEIETVVTYSAAVSGVNNSYIYDKNGNERAHLTSDLYYNIGSSTTTQYEFTSKGTCNFRVPRSEVGSAVFDVKLYVSPVDVTVTVRDKDGNTVKTGPGDISEYTDMTLDSVEFTLGHQDIVDAHNKCPDHSGLDFSITEDIAEKVIITPIDVDIEAKKILEGGRLRDGMFTFELLEPVEITSPAYKEDYIRKRVANDIDGKVIFDKIRFGIPGTYHYKIREVIPEGDSSYIYDNSLKDVTIEVTPDGAGNLSASVTYPDAVSGETPEFKNTALYKLPDTGGCGIDRYVICGFMMIIISSVFLILRKRRESG